jgi:hypothetical protein
MTIVNSQRQGGTLNGATAGTTPGGSQMIGIGPTKVYEMMTTAKPPSHIVAGQRLIRVSDPRRPFEGSEAPLKSGDRSERVGG